MLPKVARQRSLRIAAVVGLPLALFAQVQCSDEAGPQKNNTSGTSTSSGAGGGTTGATTSSTSTGPSSTTSTSSTTSGPTGSGGAATGAGGNGGNPTTTSGGGGSSGGGSGSGPGGSGGAGGGAGGSGGGGGAGMGGKGGAGGGTGGTGGGGGAGGSGGGGMGFTPCNTMPAATAPALKKGPAIGPFAAQAGQIVGVPGEPDVLYVIGHRNGNVYAVVNGMVQQTPFAHVNIATAGNNEQGLLSMALHPNFAQNQLFYLFYTAANTGAMVIDEFRRMSKTTATPNPTQNIYNRARADGDCASGNCFHNGGSLMFNPKDASPFLYLSIGNNTIKPQSSSATGYAGRILRFDLGTKMSTTYAYGLRNPYRSSIDRLTGDMYIGDVADAAGGSVFFKANGSAPGNNFGYSSNNEIGDGISGFQGGSAALIGGYVYRGNAIAGLCGRYFFGMHDPGTVRSFIVQNGQRMGGVANHGTLNVPNKLSSFGEDGEGELYVASMGDNVIYKIIAGP